MSSAPASTEQPTAAAAAGVHPFLLLNSASGGGHVQSSILAVAAERGIEHHVVGPGDDFDASLRAAIGRGADLLVAAGGDGTLCAVAGVAMAHDLAMVVVPAGTRNHFALDLGLPLDDPAAVLRQSLELGHERRVDVGLVNGTPFLNNVSLGLYPTAERRSDYRQHKAAAFVAAAREALTPAGGGNATLTIAAPGCSLTEAGEGTSVVMVVNNAYAPGFAPGKRLRPSLDAGQVWVYVGGGLDLGDSGLAALVHDVESAMRDAPLRAAFGAQAVTVGADTAYVPIAVDGEARPDLAAPFEFSSGRGALRLRVPTDPRVRVVDVRLSW